MQLLLEPPKIFSLARKDEPIYGHVGKIIRLGLAFQSSGAIASEISILAKEKIFSLSIDGFPQLLGFV